MKKIESYASVWDAIAATLVPGAGK